MKTFKVAEFDLMFNHGISYYGDMLDMAVAAGVVVRSGAWYHYGQITLGQGREVAKYFLGANLDLCKEIEEKTNTQPTE